MAARATALNARVKGLQFDFSNMFKGRIAANDERKNLDRVMGRIPNALNARDADFHYFTAAPEFSLWDRGTKRKYGRIFDRTWKVPVLRYATGIEWDRDDEDDDLTNRMRPQMEDTIDKAIEIDFAAYFAILTGTTSSQYLRSIPLAADGLSLFSAARTNYFPGTGNLINGSGVSTPAQIVSDFIKVRSVFARVRDDNGTLYHGMGRIQGGMTIIFNDVFMREFVQAFRARNFTVNGGAEDNVIVMQSSLFGQVTLWGTPRLTGRSWYAILDKLPEKGIFALERRDLGATPETLLKNETNCSECAEYNVRRLQFRKRVGFGVSLPLGMIKVLNA